LPRPFGLIGDGEASAPLRASAIAWSAAAMLATWTRSLVSNSDILRVCILGMNRVKNYVGLRLQKVSCPLLGKRGV
jgi:hypothetical protein